MSSSLRLGGFLGRRSSAGRKVRCEFITPEERVHRPEYQSFVFVLIGAAPTAHRSRSGQPVFVHRSMLRGTRPRRRVIGPKVGSLKGTSNSGVKALTLEQSMAFGWTYPESPKVEKKTPRCSNTHHYSSANRRQRHLTQILSSVSLPFLPLMLSISLTRSF